MKIALLSRNAKLYSSRRLIEAAEARGHEMVVMDTLKFVIDVSSDGPTMTYDGKPVDDIEAVIPRVGVSVTFYGTAVVRQFEMMDVYTLNGSVPINRSRDKLRALQVLSREGLGMPRTSIAHSSSLVEEALAHVGGAPAIIKSLEGTQGLGVGIVESDRSAKSVIEAFRAQDVNILIQEFVEEAGNSDLRALVVGGKVVAAMLRTGAEGDFRSNLHRGGSSKTIELTADEERTAVRAAAVTGLNMCGVDMLRGKDGPVIMEVNSTPGLEGVEASTGIDVAGEIISFIEQDHTVLDAPTRGQV
ncbi:30S ribosomal protein S6--L-glutamate ligase [Rhizobiaceae bacterium]|nr:30S ribosomal protein S6--L-glutamate ligase [Rhizobiaceae bacterium]